MRRRFLIPLMTVLPLVGCGRSATRPPDASLAAIAPSITPRSGIWYVGGHVARPGAQALDERLLSLRDGLRLSGMQKEPEAGMRVYLIRRTAHGLEELYNIDAEALFETAVGDSPLQADDLVIYGANAITRCWPGGSAREIRIR